MVVGMEKYLDIDNYYDGYKSSELNCIDLPIAAAAGFSNRDNYFYYCFLYCLHMNLHLDFQSNWVENRDSILKNMGLQFEAVAVDKSNLIKQVIRCIDEECPVILIVKYGSLFYSRYFGWGTYNHGLVLSDYNKTYGLIGIRDREIVKEHIENGYFSSDVMHRMTLESEHVISIWEKSNKQFKSENLPYSDSIFCIKSIKNCPTSFEQIFQDAMRYGDKKNMLHLYARKQIELEGTFTDANAEAMRRVFYRSFLPFFDLFEKKVPLNEREKIKYTEIKESFLKERMLAINHIQRALLRKNRSIQKLDSLLVRDNEAIDKMLDFIITLCSR